MKLVVEFKKDEYVITLNGKKVFNWRNPRRILRELRDIFNRHEILLRKGRLRG